MIEFSKASEKSNSLARNSLRKKFPQKCLLPSSNFFAPVTAAENYVSPENYSVLKLLLHYSFCP